MPLDLAEALLFRHQAKLCPPPAGAGLPEAWLRAWAVELAGLGYAPSHRLTQALAQCDLGQASAWHEALLPHLLQAKGATEQHRPLFREFPRTYPRDGLDWWWQRVATHYLQGLEQACLWCGAWGQTELLRPCGHVVCTRCFDPAAFAGCPVCGQATERPSPYAAHPLGRGLASGEALRLSPLGLVVDLEAELQALSQDWMGRSQPLRPQEAQDLEALAEAWGPRLEPWLPKGFPLRENAARVLGAWSRGGNPVPPELLAQHLHGPTDLLRYVAVRSGADAGLLGDTAWRPGPQGQQVQRTHRRFRVKALSRPLRRQLLALLEACPEGRRWEELRRHRSHWIWLGEFLHPHEHAKAFPGTAASFQALRRKDPTTKALAPRPSVGGEGRAVEEALRAGDGPSILALLGDRPGLLARRFDQAARQLQAQAPEPPSAEAWAGPLEALVQALERGLEQLPSHLVAGLRAHLATRLAPAPVRAYWPKGAIARACLAEDRRPPLRPGLVRRVTGALDRELLRRWAARGPLPAMAIDPRLARAVAPFLPRSAAESGLELPRGTRLTLPMGPTWRLFLHWCEPPGGPRTDLDLSVAFFDAEWQHLGQCSYHQLQWPPEGKLLRWPWGEPRGGGTGSTCAWSAGDRTSAPFPDGASEFVDLDLAKARAQGVRFAVVIVNAYAGLSFDRLERAYAGLSLRERPMEGEAFDPRTVAFRFALKGSNGVYLPLSIDLEAEELFWLDLQSPGEAALNNVASSRASVKGLIPRLERYFASDARPSLLELALQQAAARAERVWLGADQGAWVERGEDDPEAFLARLRAAAAGPVGPGPAPPVAGWPEQGQAIAWQGDWTLPEGWSRFALLPGAWAGTQRAVDLWP